jgi:hypothetical protein
MMNSLKQDELDDAYHRAIFDCDEALAVVIRRMFDHYQERMEMKGVSQSVWNSIRDDLHNVLSETFNDCEIKHLGPKRYAQLLDRIMQRDPDKVNRPT